MSDTESKLLAGHSPATIVGGMRVGKGHHGSNNEPKEAKTESKEPKTIEELISSESNNELEKDRKLGLMVNGMHVNIKDAFPTAAVKSYHDKPPNVSVKQHYQPAPAIFQPKHYQEFTK